MFRWVWHLCKGGESQHPRGEFYDRSVLEECACTQLMVPLIGKLGFGRLRNQPHSSQGKPGAVVSVQLLWIPFTGRGVSSVCALARCLRMHNTYNVKIVHEYSWQHILLSESGPPVPWACLTSSSTCVHIEKAHLSTSKLDITCKSCRGFPSRG